MGRLVASLDLLYNFDVPGKLEWVCEACDSPNSVEAGQPAICPFCRLTSEVTISKETTSPEASEPAVEAATQLLRQDVDALQPSEADDSVTRPYRFRR